MQDALQNEFKEFRKQIFALYDQQAYGEALVLIDRQAERFQAYESDLFFWRACLTGRLGDREQTVGWLRQAAERGYWYGEQLLRDPDLAIVHGTEELAQLQAIFNERQRQAQANAKPEREVWEPAGNSKGLLVALHGAGGSILTEGDYWRQAVDLGWRVAMLQSSQVLSAQRFHWGDREKAARELADHLAQLGQDGPHDALQNTLQDAPIVLAGYSQGGGMAIRSVLGGPVSGLARARGFLVVAPSFRMDEVQPLLKTADKRLRGYIVVGTEDKWSCGPARDLAAAMREAGLPCAIEELEGLDHDYPPDFAPILRRGLEFLGDVELRGETA